MFRKSEYLLSPKKVKKHLTSTFTEHFAEWKCWKSFYNEYTLVQEVIWTKIMPSSTIFYYLFLQELVVVVFLIKTYKTHCPLRRGAFLFSTRGMSFLVSHKYRGDLEWFQTYIRRAALSCLAIIWEKFVSQESLKIWVRFTYLFNSLQLL